MLEVESVESGYGSVQILWGVELSVQENEVHVLLGANGAGKSTLLKVLVGLLPCWAGSVHMDKEDVTRLSAPARTKAGLGFTSEVGIFPDLSVEDNLRLSSLVVPAAQRKDAIEAAYSRFAELRGRRRALAGGLSGGQRKLVAIARALVSRPKVLLLDEPSAGLSPRYVSEVVERLAELRGTTTLLVAEQNVSFLEIADTVSVLEGGRVRFSGSKDSFGNDTVLRDAFFGLE
ncbi:ABC transporter ATP-binding protein [Ferrimicrobium sp.]|uniref:ABC transporter ATP-binding protein n=1 Tax=Ferrimicrobium sp. TaxID=2926050 RepID=UPI002606FD85|nr:ABC transporter ATP-binding protein [Ferrimicrobium sp.]